MTDKQIELEKLKETKRNNLEKEKGADEERKESRRHNRKDEKNKKDSNDIALAGHLLGLGNTAIKAGFDASKMAYASAANDPAWYDHNPEITSSVANFSYNSQFGYPFTLGTSTEQQYPPAICVLHTVPTFGNSTSYDSAINVAARNTYSYVRYHNSGSRNYEAPDLMFYILAMSSAYAYHAEMTRLYAALQTYSAENKYIGRHLVETLGFNYDDLIQHQVDLRGYLNTFRLRLSTLKIPDVYPIIRRHYYLFSTVFTDSKKSAMDQLYVYKPVGYYMWDQDPFTKLTFRGAYGNNGHVATYRRSFEEIVYNGNELLNAILSDSDAGIISGDIVKAYGERTFSLAETPEGLTLTMVTGDLERLQIMNSCIGVPTTQTAGFVLPNEYNFNFDYIQSENSGAIISPMYIEMGPSADAPNAGMFANYTALKDNHLVRVNDDPIQGKELLEILENQFNVSRVISDEINRLVFENVGSTLVIAAQIMLEDPIDGTIYKSIASGKPRDTFGTSLEYVAFDYAPTTCVVNTTNVTTWGTTRVARLASWLARYFVITPEKLANVRTATMLSLMGVPQNQK